MNMTPTSAGKRVLLTGASGFIGSGVLEYLLALTDWTFTCVCSWRHHGNPLHITPNERVRVVTHDLIGPLPDLGQYDYILNLASESHVDRSIKYPVEFIENNVSSTLMLLEYARQHPPDMFIQFSTDEVYGARQHEEWDVLLPSNPYSASKAAQEMLAIAYWSTYGVPVVITNSNNIIGANQDREKFVPKLIDLIGRDQLVTIHISEGKPGKRFYNPVQNVADALLFILRHPQPSTDRPPRFNLPGGEQLDNLEMAKLIAELMDKELHFALLDADTVRPGYDQFYPETEGRLTFLGWTPPFDLNDELRRVVHDYLVDRVFEGAS